MSVGRIWQTENFKDLAKEKTKQKLKRDTFCALSECSLAQGLQTPSESWSSELTDYKRLQVKALRLQRAIQSHSETAFITWLISPALQ